MSIMVLNPGLLTTVQDMGRLSAVRRARFRSHGPPSGGRR